MFRKASLAGLAVLTGCSLLPSSIRQQLPASAQNLSQAVPPGAGLTLRAARMQDSLRTRLEWATAGWANNAPLIERVAFHDTLDTIHLDVELTDANGWNSHGKDSLHLALLESSRWQPVFNRRWPKTVQQAGLKEFPLRIRLAYRFHDVQRGRSDWSWDTLNLTLSDSAKVKPTR
jgi:hypothetical protein